MKLVFKDKDPPRLRIADILLIEEEEEDDEDRDLLLMDGCTGGVSRWLSRFRMSKVKRISEQVVKREQDVSPDISCSTDVFNGGDLPCTDPQSHHSGCPIESSFNAGVGCYLLYLIVASKNELDKMMELRTQMEMLLQNAKKELQTKDNLVNSFESNDICAYSTTNVREGVESNYHHSPHSTTSYVLPESEQCLEGMDQALKCDTPKSEQCLEGMDQLEAELESELEQFFLQHLQQQRIEVTVKDTDSARSQSLSSGEVIDPVVDPQEELDYGVPPYELERRLHEVLEARQQEQIRELEAALECAKHKLHEKEIEISWWKDTARLISQHIPGTSRHILDHDQETYHFLR